MLTSSLFGFFKTLTDAVASNYRYKPSHARSQNDDQNTIRLLGLKTSLTHDSIN